MVRMILLAMAVMLVTPASAQDCSPASAALQSIAVTHPIKHTVTLSAEQVERVVAWYNAQPPASKYDYNFAIVISHTSGQLGLLLGKDGNVCKASLVSEENTPGMLAAIVGAHAEGWHGLVHLAQHPQQDMELHLKFYQTWYMPDDPSKSCCNHHDCYPTQAKFERGQWWALRREDQRYIPVPWEKVEQRRDNPDGRSHLCAPPADSLNHPPNTVFCFSLGGGT